MFAKNINDNDSMIILTCKSNLPALCESDVILGDGTFFVTPPHFQQVYTLHAYNDGKYMPLLFALLPNKKEETYKFMIAKIYRQCQNSNMSFLPKMVVLDFEMAAINAFREFFVVADINLCRFYWSQSVFRKIAGSGLKKDCPDNNNKIGQWLKLFFG